MTGKKDKVFGFVTALFVHLLIVTVLVLLRISKPEPQREGGVEVVLGMVEVSSGDVAMANAAPQNAPIETSHQQETKNSMITQDDPSVAIENKKKNEEAERQKKEEIRKRNEEALERKTENVVSGAFGKGNATSKGSKNKSDGIEGSTNGNSDKGKSVGVGGYGSFDLDGRSLGSGSLPFPHYTVKEEGDVVVDIWVNASGKVVRTNINQRRTDTSSPALREAAEKAAALALFNAVDGANIQKGTITYKFRLK